MKTPTSAAFLTQCAWREDDGSLPWYTAGHDVLRTLPDAVKAAEALADRRLYDAVRVVDVRDQAVILLLTREHAPAATSPGSR